MTRVSTGGVARAAAAIDSTVATVAADAASAPATDALRELLLRSGVRPHGIDQAVEAVLAHPTPDAVIGAIPFMTRAETFHSQLVPMSIAAVDSGHLPRITATIDELAAAGVTGNGLSTQLVEVAGHPRLDEIVALAPTIRRAGTYSHFVVGAARDAVESGHAESYLRAMRTLVADGISDGSIGKELVAVAGHPRLDEITGLTSRMLRMGSFSFTAVPQARAIVEAGHATRFARAIDTLTELGIGNNEMVTQLVDLVDDPRFHDIVGLAARLDRLMTNGYDVVPMATKLLDSGHADDVVRMASELADDGIVYFDLVPRLLGLVDHPKLDQILATTRVVRSAGSKVHDLTKARHIVDSPHADVALELLQLIVERTGPNSYAPVIALDLASRGLQPEAVRAAVAAGLARIDHHSVQSAIRAGTLDAMDLQQLGGALAGSHPRNLLDQSRILEAITRKLDAASPIDEADGELLTRLASLVGDNHDRLTGKLVDGYRGFPEYADYGRIDATIRLRELRAGAVGSAASETLGW